MQIADRIQSQIRRTERIISADERQLAALTRDAELATEHDDRAWRIACAAACECELEAERGQLTIWRAALATVESGTRGEAVVQ